MPKDESFWNPYRLVPARETVERLKPLTDEKFQGINGRITCTIKNLTPLFIGGQSSGAYHPPAMRREKRIIPGSSLKGMFRSIAELAGGGCFVVSSSIVPHEMRSCSRVQELCIACRMFGAMERKTNARVHKGNVRISDAILLDERPKVKSMEVLLSNHGTRHEPFYRTPGSEILDGRSRKLYFHQPQCKEALQPVSSGGKNNAWQIEALLPGHIFNFDVEFANLRDSELSLLLYVLCLEENVSVIVGEKNINLKGPMRHKIGNAKPLGLGSCHIAVTNLEFLPPPSQRFTSLAAGKTTSLSGNALIKEIEKRVKPYTQDHSPTMQALRKMMVWDENDQRQFRYPGYKWFQNSKNSNKPLKTI